MPKFKKQLLIVNDDSRLVKSTSAQLAKSSIHTRTIHTQKSLALQIHKSKPNAILVSDYGDDVAVLEVLKSILDNAETRNVRLIVLSKNTERPFVEEVLSFGVRDIIPRYVGVKDIVKRILFAIRGNEAEYIPDRLVHFPYSDRIKIESFSKFTSISEHELVIETPVIVEQQQRVQLRVPFWRDFGLGRVAGTVLETRERGLLYHMSRAVVVKPDISEVERKSLQAWIEKHRTISCGKRVPVYCALKDRDLRNKLLDQHASQNYFIRLAWSKATVFKEPLFLAPQIIIIDEIFLNEESIEEFTILLEKLQTRTFIVVNQQTRNPKLKTFFQNFETMHQVLFFSRLTVEKIQLIIDDLVTKLTTRRNASGIFEQYAPIYIPENHRFSKCYMVMDAELSYVGNNELQFVSRYQISRFTHVKASSAFLNKKGIFPAYLKICDVFTKSRLGKTDVKLKRKYAKEFFYEAYFVCFAAAKRYQLKNFMLEKLFMENQKFFSVFAGELEGQDAEVITKIEPPKDNLDQLSPKQDISRDTEEVMVESKSPTPEVSKGVPKTIQEDLDKEVADQLEHETLEREDIDQVEDELELSDQFDTEIPDDIPSELAESISEVVKDDDYWDEEPYIPLRKGSQKKTDSSFNILKLLKVLLIIFVVLFVLLISVVYIFPMLEKGSKMSSSRFTESFRSIVQPASDK